MGYTTRKMYYTYFLKKHTLAIAIGIDIFQFILSFY